MTAITSFKLLTYHSKVEFNSAALYYVEGIKFDFKRDVFYEYIIM